MPNRTIKGFRYARGAAHSSGPAIEEGVVASAYGTALYEGQPVLKVDAGTFELCPAGTATIYGIIVGINQYYDSTDSRVKKPLGSAPKRLPASTTYTGVDNESRIAVMPVKGLLFEVDADAALATPTLAGARALIGSNGDHVISTDDAALDISDVEAKDGTPASAQWSVVDVDPNQDFTASRVKFIVSCNEPQFLLGGIGL
jgi:hypothetical protein